MHRNHYHLFSFPHGGGNIKIQKPSCVKKLFSSNGISRWGTSALYLMLINVSLLLKVRGAVEKFESRLRRSRLAPQRPVGRVYIRLT